MTITIIAGLFLIGIAALEIGCYILLGLGWALVIFGVIVMFYSYVLMQELTIKEIEKIRAKI